MVILDRVKAGCAAPVDLPRCALSPSWRKVAWSKIVGDRLLNAGFGRR